MKQHVSFLCSLHLKVKWLSRVWLFATPWTVAYRAPLSMGFSKQEYWSGLPLLLQGIFPTQGSNLCVLYLLHCSRIILPLSHWGFPSYVTSNLLNPSTSYILNHIRAEEIKFCSKSYSYFQWCWPAKPILFAFPSYLFHLLKAYSIYYRRSVHRKCPTHVFEWKKEKCPREYHQRVENVSPEIFSWM